MGGKLGTNERTIPLKIVETSLFNKVPLFLFETKNGVGQNMQSHKLQHIDCILSYTFS